MGSFIKVAKKQDIAPGQGIVCEVQGKTVALFNVGSEFCAMTNRCPHRGGPLGEGDLQGTVVTCPWHAWQFDVKTGANVENPEQVLPTYQVKVEGEGVWVEVD